MTTADAGSATHHSTMPRGWIIIGLAFAVWGVLACGIWSVLVLLLG